MPDYTITLTTPQDQALAALTEDAQVAADDDTITALATLQALVNTALQPKEEEIEATLAALLVAGHALPAVVRDWMTATLTVPQLEVIVHLQTPVADAQQG